ncbi:hypothetical protein ACFX13_022080 [Malus domestica]|uniref:uncharacterized protein n=1 Tax=Malus domestica TaxID=3750 RepID=UPI000499275E|nr:uncharacterized protein LOC103403633 [Malus domestica]
MAGAGGEPNGFKHFDVVSKSDGGVCFGNKVHHKIMQEWKILEKHLPNSIYVHIYETHIDLLRAIIIDAAGIPYHDALFLFDIAFHSNYPTRLPQRPPKNFEALVDEHLRQRESVILRACVAYVSVSVRVAVGYYNEGHANGAGSARKVRKKFRKSVKLLYPQLFEGFRSNGACLEGLAENLKVKNKKKVTSKKKAGSSFKRHAEVAASVD